MLDTYYFSDLTSVVQNVYCTLHTDNFVIYDTVWDKSRVVKYGENISRQSELVVESAAACHEPFMTLHKLVNPWTQPQHNY